MRTLFGTAAVILLTAGTAGAARAQELHAGLLAGPAVSEITFDDPGDVLDPRIGATLGFYLVIGAGGPFALQSEIALSQKGVGFPDQDADGNPIDATYSIGYLELPLLARISYPEWPVRPFLMAGPVAAYRATARYTADGYESVDATLDTEKFDLCVAGGAGIEFDADQGAIQISVRYSHGLFDVDASDAGLAGKNRTISLVVGFGRVFRRY